MHYLIWRNLRIIAIAASVLFVLITVWLWQDIHFSSYICDGPTVISTTRPFRANTHLIPPNIWQIMLPKPDAAPGKPIAPAAIEDTLSWIGMNPDYRFTMVGELGAHEFLHRHFDDNPRIIKAFKDMQNLGMKSDFLRYLLLSVEGGVYTDTDTIARRPIDDWVPERLRDQVRAIIGIEYDRRKGNPVDTIPYFVQFCQWTIAAAPGHPIFSKMTDRILGALEDLERKHGKPLNEIQPEYFDVLNTTGPPSWTAAVFEQLHEYEPQLKDTKDLSYMEEPRLIGDILVLAIDGFGMGQRHSGSTHNGSIPEQALISHKFKGTWKTDNMVH
ncbi:glycosyltransferase family 32 protein [Mariannaea sp. PMI_226]|nr:glycosyltransferase family 32 protein [Mariannaea sp. PMI_226]